MTAPPENATRSAAAWPLARAASAVRTLAWVAALIPKKPARIEHSAPPRYAAPVRHPMARVRSPATTTMKGTSTEYSRRRNASAPVRMSPATTAIAGDPSGYRRMAEATSHATPSPASPATIGR